ncbi:MAG: aspartate/tyrosine/aromatic aminotransferase [Proteobacteria bacterium]|nr:aspartate/tyrosine/aromatic aminotransferase [Pseudomonadota bacterium]
MFASLSPRPADAILGLIAEYKKDPRPQKIDLGIGVYRTADGETPVLNVVKQAERQILESQTSKAYLGTAGEPSFNAAIQSLIFADSVSGERLTTVQTPGGSGSLRVAASLLQQSATVSPVWVSDPTWSNHVPLLGGAGLELPPYPYYDTEKHVIRVDAMLETLRTIPKGETVLFHACCHNPSGLDPADDTWRAITDIVVERELLPFIDMAYQGFSRGLDEDAFAIRHMAERVPEMLVSSSCSKNFGLYRDRVGTLSVMAADAATSATVASQLSFIARTIYSMPPDHGAAIVSTILADDSLTSDWHGELADMRQRLRDMRELISNALHDKAPDHDFSHLVRATGMFCFLGISGEQIATLKNDYGVYLVGSSRVNIAGITPANVDYLAESIAAVL